MVQLIGLPGGITPPGHERRVFRLAIIIGAVLIVAALIFMSWQKSPAEHPFKNIFLFSNRSKVTLGKSLALPEVRPQPHIIGLVMCTP